MNKTKILILCTGNSARSQMAEAILNHYGKNIIACSAGVKPAKQVNPNTIKVMEEIGIDISNAQPKNVSLFINDSFDYVITVCDNARETCPNFSGDVKNRLHYSIPDPDIVAGDDAAKLDYFRKIRDLIKELLKDFIE